jgi:catalase-peroxidase
MAMNDEETVALIAGGHTFGKTHGAADPSSMLGGNPRLRPLKSRAWAGSQQLRHGNRRDTFTSGLEVIWSSRPNEVEQSLL